MAGKRRFDEQTTTQEPYSRVQVEGGFTGCGKTHSFQNSSILEAV
jgi:hypothetical protein